jgi:hypothetical protein
LNACGSAAGEVDVSLRGGLIGSSFCGAIATEAIVPTAFAADFGAQFLRLVTEGKKSIAEAMYLLQHSAALWPESLLYGCYADPNFQIT